MTYGSHQQQPYPPQPPYPPQGPAAPPGTAAPPGHAAPPGRPAVPPGPAASPAPVVIDVAGDAKVKAMIGGAVAGAIGLLAVISALTGQTPGGSGTAVAVGIVGAIFLLIGLLPVFTWKKLARPRRLVFDAAGVRWDDPQGRPWAAAWRRSPPSAWARWAFVPRWSAARPVPHPVRGRRRECRPGRSTPAAEARRGAGGARGSSPGVRPVADRGVGVHGVRDGLEQAAAELGDDAVRAAHHRIEHAELPSPRAMRIFARLGVTCSMQPMFEGLWGGPL